MASSHTITLFSDQSQVGQRPTSFLLSVLVHGAVVGLIALGFILTPDIRPRRGVHYVVRQVDLDQAEAEIRRAGGQGSMYPAPLPDSHAEDARGGLQAPASSQRQMANRKPAPQTIVQPDIPPNTILPKALPLPAMLLWKVSKPNVKKLTPPPPQPAKAQLPPKPDIPNQETILADVQLTSTPFRRETLKQLPSTTTPVPAHQNAPVQLIPQTTSVSSLDTASAAVMSVSDISLARGSVSLPPANQSATGNPNGGMAPGRSGDASKPGNGDPANSGNATGKGAGRIDTGGQGAGAGKGGAQKGAGNGAGNGTIAGSRPGQGSGSGSASGSGSGNGDGDSGYSTARITLPKGGNFSAVMVGNTMEDQYPETSSVWGGRAAYTAYLHVGLAKSWIVQYALPRSADMVAEDSVSHLDAPWPFYIVRPNLDPYEVNADALLVRGIVNEAGRFEELAVVFPAAFERAQFVLDALKQWQFRPAKQNGQNTKVEVLVIIPELTN